MSGSLPLWFITNLGAMVCSQAEDKVLLTEFHAESVNSIKVMNNQYHICEFRVIIIINYRRTEFK